MKNKIKEAENVKTFEKKMDSSEVKIIKNGKKKQL